MSYILKMMCWERTEIILSVQSSISHWVSAVISWTSLNVILDISSMSYHTSWAITDPPEVISLDFISAFTITLWIAVFCYCIFLNFQKSIFQTSFKFGVYTYTHIHIHTYDSISSIHIIFPFIHLYCHVNAMFWWMEGQYAGSLLFLKPETDG